MVTGGFPKRACAVVLVNKVKNPIKLAREMLVRGEKDDSGGGDQGGDAGGAQGHCCLGGETVEKLAKDWGLEMVKEDYFWTRKRWDEHKRGLHESVDERALKRDLPCSEQDIGWDGEAYLPQGTVGCVALDRYGKICVATSTGGLTNKLSGRIGDTPTIGGSYLSDCVSLFNAKAQVTRHIVGVKGPLKSCPRLCSLARRDDADCRFCIAGFWAEEWKELSPETRTRQPQDLLSRITTGLNISADALRNVMGDCIPRFSGFQELPSLQLEETEKLESTNSIRAVAMSGTGNGDSFLRLAAARSAGAIVRFSRNRSLASAVNQIAGPGGELEQSAGDRWGKTGEGEGGIIGIELIDGKGNIVFDFNCGGMFRCWVDNRGKERVMVFKDEY